MYKVILKIRTCSLTKSSDAAIVGGFVLMTEANALKGDPGKKRGKSTVLLTHSI